MSLELTDLHNRRANIETVSKLAKEHGTPLLTWPEDRELLRLDDLPEIVRVNIPRNWIACEPSMYWIVNTDETLRDIIIIGRAYSINPAIEQFNGAKFVQEWKVTTR